MTNDAPLTPNALAVLNARYLARDERGDALETPPQLFRRVAQTIAQGEAAHGGSPQAVAALSDAFYALLSELRFLPNSPALMNAARPLGQLSACYVLPVEDQLDAIFETLKHAALIHQSGGGTGFSFSRLRPSGDRVRSTMGVSSGPVSFMAVYNAATDAIKQGGTRRGANMGVLNVDHPDIEAFIACKQDAARLTNFNISVGVTDAFMDAVRQDAPFDLRHPTTGETIKTVAARALFEQITRAAWQNGEPGVLFIDRINADQPTPALGPIEATNPCGEVPLLPYEACNLGSIHLGRMLTRDGQVDWDGLARVTRLATRFLDNVITVNRFPLPQTEAMALANRKIGLGVMGWADLLLARGLPYNSDAAVSLAREVAAWIDFHAKRASMDFARERGAFSHFSQSRYAVAGWLTSRRAASERIRAEDWRALEADIIAHGLRNATVTCIAPTGTISVIAGASGGIEPLFSIAFVRQVLEGARLNESHPLFESIARERGFWRDGLMDAISQTGSIAAMTEIPDDVRRVFVTAHDIAPEWHIRMQSAFQAYTDNAVSKTINFPQEASLEDVAQAYRQAYDTGVLKGLTAYRDKSRAHQPMALTAPPEGDAPGSCSLCD
ncbi:MAG: adenosylcobalamin-dependent ribonucleoside-diphosphate reductase [Vampirovibrionales bacterium]|nr:adenosylcobalamin-dependent ribonucleoside-diphosphate reductase [Vampirovibrionales bacterium]